MGVVVLVFVLVDIFLLFVGYDGLFSILFIKLEYFIFIFLYFVELEFVILLDIIFSLF